MTATNWILENVSPWGDFFDRLTARSTSYICVALGASCLALLLTPPLRALAARMGMVDEPGPRRINKKPIPRGGGLAIILAMNLMLWIYTAFSGGRPVSEAFSIHWQQTFLIASVWLAVIGFLDDRRGLPAPVKLFGHVAVASLFFFSGIRWGHVLISLPPWIDYFLTVFWIVGAINAFNLIDGMDGLASGLALIASLGLAGALISQNRAPETVPYLIFAGACLGFLRYNFNPASVFLGDTGSMFLGMTLATLPLVSGSRQEVFISLGMPLLAMGVPIFDTFLAIWRRAVRSLLPKNVVRAIEKDQGGGALMQPDKDHLHHRLLRIAMGDQRKAAWFLYTINGILVGLGIFASFSKGRAPGLFMVAFIVFATVIVRHFKFIEMWDTGHLLIDSSQGRRRRYKGLLLPLSILLDLTLLVAAWLFAWYFLFDTLPPRGVMMKDMPIFIVPVFVSLAVARVYPRVWSRARVRDFLALALATLSGTVIGGGIYWLCFEHKTSLLRMTLLFGSFSLLSLCAARVWREGIIGLSGLFEKCVLSGDAAHERILVYGGGMTLRGFLRERIDRETDRRRLVVGVLDDEPMLKGRMVAGFPVLGGQKELERLVRESGVTSVVLTCVMPPEKEAEIVRRLKALPVRVSVWRSDEYSL